MNKKRKSKSKFIVLGIIIAVVIGLVILKPGAKLAKYDEETAKTGNITTYYSFSGNIEAIDKQMVMADQMMQIEKISVNEGDQVKKGDVLIETTQGEKLTSKIDGEVAKIYIEESAQLMPGSQLLNLTNYDKLQVTIKVDEFDLGAVAAGKEVKVTVNALNKEISGKVKKVSREAITVNGVSYFTASVDLEKDADLLVGMSVEVQLLNESVADATVLPMKAIQFDSENKPYVYYTNDSDKVEAKSVTLGINDGATVEIKSGVKSGETIEVPQLKNGSRAPFGPGADDGGGEE
ncbi:MAG: HlyD family efflux transporter periplasmic adaptor subunit [Gorillibacterium sp.]|nr:HlyD family efflux transporter periplasmic adaptor subunit [Gorillibacterium sp.]